MNNTATLLANLKFYAGEASCHPDPDYCLEFEKLCTPSNILTLLEMLEAERQRAAEINRQYLRVVSERDDAVDELEELRNEISQLKGEQVPVAWTDAEELRDMTTDGCAYLFKVDPANPFTDPRRQIMLYDRPQKPVVLPTKRQWVSFYRENDPNHCPAHHRNEGYLQGIFEMTQAIEAAGGIVKDGE